MSATIGVLGPVVVFRGGAWRPAGGRQRLLLALLVSRCGMVVPGAELVDAIWGERLPADPPGALHLLVWRLRRGLIDTGAVVETVGSAYRLRAPAGVLDSGCLEDLFARARERRDAPEASIGLLEAALGLWRGAAFGEEADHLALRGPATRLAELRAEVVEARAELLLSVGRGAEAMIAVDELARDHPYRERPIEIAMRLRHAMGRQAEALATFAEFRRRLSTDLGLEPSPTLRSVHAMVLRARPQRSSGLSLPGDSFVGRETDVAAVVTALGQVRLLTVIGPPGVGKTRLCLHAADLAVETYPDGVALLELAPVTDPHHVPAAVASALGVQDTGGQDLTERLGAFLRRKQMLLVVDNCEHVLDAVRELVGAVQAGAPNVRVLASSRHPLRIDGERLHRLEPLAVPRGPDDVSAAVILFADRAAAARPGFALTPANLPAAARLCARLGGLPLALELAAARAVACTPDEILSALADRAGSLADPRRAVERHASMQAVVDWSYDLLTPATRALFRHTAVFAGGCTAPALAAVAGVGDHDAVLDGLTSLVEHSLVRPVDHGERTRFGVLEPLRQYATDRLAESGELRTARAAHARWFREWLVVATTGLHGPQPGRWAAQLDQEFANLRGAHRWHLDNDPSGAVEMVAGPFWWMIWFAPAEVFDWVERTIATIGDAGHPQLPTAYAVACAGAWRGGDLSRARTLAVWGIEAADARAVPGCRRYAVLSLGIVELLSGNLEASLACHEEAAALSREANDESTLGGVLAQQGLLHQLLGQPERAVAAAAQARALLPAAGRPMIRAACDYTAGEMHLETEPLVALPLLRRARDAARAMGNGFVAGVAGLSAVSCAARLGEVDETLDEYVRMIHHWHRAGAWTQQWITIRTLVDVLVRLGMDDAAALLLGALRASPTAPPVTGADAERLAVSSAVLRLRLGADRLERLTAEGAALDDDQAVIRALRAAGSRDR